MKKKLTETKKQSSFKIYGIDHIAIATNKKSDARHFFEDILSLKYLSSEDVVSQNTHTRIISSYNDNNVSTVNNNDKQKPPSLPTKLEFVSGISKDNNPISKFLEKKGGSGVHHIAFRVDDINLAIEDMIKKGIKMINEKAITGTCNSLIAFVHPSQTGGILVEFVQKSTSTEK